MYYYAKGYFYKYTPAGGDLEGGKGKGGGNGDFDEGVDPGRSQNRAGSVIF